mmetsp:Transcript_66188/g.147112  ORF Transcript_66188/g.147112 Transcript_66188/m.147112 type:complete len:530 (+) Transcript_66188:32-1621(+)
MLARCARSWPGWQSHRALCARTSTVVSESTFGLLQQIKGSPGKEEEGTLQSVAGSVLRVSLPGQVFVGQGLRIREEPAVILRFDKAGVVAALLQQKGAALQAGDVVLPDGALGLQAREWPAAVSYASVGDLITTSGEAVANLLRLPSAPTVTKRRPIRKHLPCGLAAAEMLLPLGQGHRVGLVGPPGCGKSTALRMIAASQDPTTAIVYAGVRPSERLRSDFSALGLEGGRSAPAVVLSADPRASAAERYFLVLGALNLAKQLRASHTHVLLAVDDCMNFAEAGMELAGAPPIPPPQALAAMLDAGGNLAQGDGETEHALSVAVALDLAPDEELSTLPREVWRGAEPSLDVCLNFSNKLAAQGTLPAIDPDLLLGASGYPPHYQLPILRAMRSELQRLLQRSQQLRLRLDTGKELGFHAEADDLDALGSDSVARALLAHSKPRELHELVVLVCASVVYYFPHHKVPPRSAVAGFQAEVLHSIMSECPAVWESLRRASELNSEEAALLLRDLGEALLARRFSFKLTRSEM